MFKIKKQKNKGFTLVELLVSIGIFSIVLVVILGAIISIIDVNRKAKTLSLVMNNLNFAVESMTRTIKTNEFVSIGGNGQTLTITEDGQPTTYTLNNNQITKNGVPVTSPEIVVEQLNFTNSNDGQPIVIIGIQGKAQIGEKAVSDFAIQTAVSQRKLKLD